MLTENEDLTQLFRANSVQHYILKTLKNVTGKDADGIWAGLLPEKIKLISLDDLRANYLPAMGIADLVMHSGDYYSLTLNGYAVLKFLDLKAANKKQTVAVTAPRTYQASGTYRGEELQATCQRRGAYDYLALPSKMASELVPHPNAHLAEQS